jgi:hypothetical protein
MNNTETSNKCELKKEELMLKLKDQVNDLKKVLFEIKSMIKEIGK